MSQRLRTRLVLVYLAATVLPLVLTIWTSIFLLDRSLNLSPVGELDRLSQTLQRLGREHYQAARETLSADAAAGRAQPVTYAARDQAQWPATVRDFFTAS